MELSLKSSATGNPLDTPPRDVDNTDWLHLPGDLDDAMLIGTCLLQDIINSATPTPQWPCSKSLDQIWNWSWRWRDLTLPSGSFSSNSSTYRKVCKLTNSPPKLLFMMMVIWNVRGARRRTLHGHMQHVLQKFKPSMVILLETKVEQVSNIHTFKL